MPDRPRVTNKKGDEWVGDNSNDKADLDDSDLNSAIMSDINRLYQLTKISSFVKAMKANLMIEVHDKLVTR